MRARCDTTLTGEIEQVQPSEYKFENQRFDRHLLFQEVMS